MRQGSDDVPTVGRSGEKHTEQIEKKVAKCVDNSRSVTVETYVDRTLQGSVSEAAANHR